MENLNLDMDQKELLLKIARSTIENAVKGKPSPDFEINDPMLGIQCGAFVTIHLHGGLRGCIGNITAETGLWETVRNMAAEASLRDPRFPAVSPGELKEIDIEISALSPLRKIADIEEIEVGKHGLIIKSGFYQGLLLPQVASDHGWNRIQLLQNTCSKAGLDKNCYKEKDCEIFIFSAAVFGEKDIKRQ